MNYPTLKIEASCFRDETCTHKWQAIEVAYNPLRSDLGLHRHHSVPFRTPGRILFWINPQAFQQEIDGSIPVIA